MELAYQPIKISSFGEDAAGELYVVDIEGGTVYRVTDGVADITTSGVDRTEAR